jgi:hypothetical protein
MPVSSLNHVTAAAASVKSHASAKAPTGASFAGALAQASTTTKASHSKATENAAILDSTKVPKGEKTKPVDGHKYADITAGPRNGMFLNTSGNKRNGQAFVLVKRDGKEFHVYGTGKDRLVVCLKRAAADDKASTKTDAATTTPVTNTAPSGTTGAAL